MATILIQADASFDYPLASDNVFGPPRVFPSEVIPYLLVGEFGGNWGVFWFDANGIYHNQDIFLFPEPHILPVDGGHGALSGAYTWLASNGIVFTPNSPVYWAAQFGETNIIRYEEPSLPSRQLAYADTITNLSATGAELLGYGGADTITGGAGGDTLDGGSGADSMAGGLGDDVYYVNVSNDQVLENAGEGFDTVYVGNAFTATAGSSIERMVALGAGNVSMTGNGLAIEMVGNAGVNTLDDAGGAATLRGRSSTDVYLVHSAATWVIELAGEGYDTVRTDLAAYTLGANLEVLTRLGSTAFAGTGNGLANAITGGAEADTLNGAGGNDVLTGGGGADIFRFDGLTLGQDNVTDFASGVDRIGLDDVGFGIASLANVVLVADGTVTAVGQATLHYYANGGLSYDANGGSAADAVFFATLNGHPSLAISDFVLV
ncbi:hypothetical protein BH10PSE3_BH10PSE3_35950 [soil metagenome]